MGCGVRVGAYLSLSGRGRWWGGGGRLLTFSALRMGAYSRWALIRGRTLIRINTGNRQQDRILKLMAAQYLLSGLLVFINHNSLWIQHEDIHGQPLGRHPQWVGVRY